MMKTLPLLALSISLSLISFSVGCKDAGAKEGHGGDEHGEHGGDEHGEHGGDEHGEHGGDEHGEHGGDEHGEHGGGEHAGEVRLSPEAVARIGIRISTVDAAPAVGGIEVPAEIQADPAREAHVSSVVSGQLAKVTASMGDRVEAGQVLAVVRSVALGEARAQLARAQANVAVAQSNFSRQEELQKEGIGAKRQFLEAQAQLLRAKAEQSAASRALEVYGRGGSGSEVAIKSPIAGRILRRHATVGEVVKSGTVLFNITDISKVWVMGRVYQQNAGQVAEGAPATLTLQAYPGRSFQGVIDYVAPSLDDRTRTLPVRVALENAEGILRPGLFGTLSIGQAGGAVADVPTIASSAVQRMGDRTVVFVPADEKNEFKPVDITVASRARGLVRIQTGLKIGDKYVSAGAFVLKSEISRSELGEGHVH